MSPEVQAALVGLVPLVFLLSFPIGTYYLLQGVNHYFRLFRTRVNFLRAYLCIMYVLAGAAFYTYLEVVRALNFLVAMMPILYFLFVPGLLYAFLNAINHFFGLWETKERILDIHLAALFAVSLISFIGFFFFAQDVVSGAFGA